MFRKTDLPELLSPAGDMECLYAAVAGGADDELACHGDVSFRMRIFP